MCSFSETFFHELFYNALNRVTSETDPLGNTKYFGYDKNSEIVSVTDRNGNTTGYTLDGNGNIVTVTDAAGIESHYAYDSMNRFTKISMHRVDKTHKVDEWQDTLYTYDHRGLVKTEINAKSDGKVFVYDENGNLISKTDWNGTTTFERDLLNRLVKVTDHNDRVAEYGWDNVGNKTFKEYPNYGTAYYFYDACDQVIEMDEYNLGGKKFYKTTYSWDAEGNLLTEMQYNHGQSGQSGNGNGNGNGNGKGNNSNAAELAALFDAASGTENRIATGNILDTSALLPETDAAGSPIQEWRKIMILFSCQMWNCRRHRFHPLIRILNL